MTTTAPTASERAMLAFIDEHGTLDGFVHPHHTPPSWTDVIQSLCDRGWCTRGVGMTLTEAGLQALERKSEEKDRESSA
jgi:hypothetical protein